MTEFAAPWGNFYVIVGSSGAALIGIQFVVIALIADRRAVATAEAIRAFATPTVVDLGAAPARCSSPSSRPRAAARTPAWCTAATTAARRPWPLS